jgi:hypothetical protein
MCQIFSLFPDSFCVLCLTQHTLTSACVTAVRKYDAILEVMYGGRVCQQLTLCVSCVVISAQASYRFCRTDGQHWAQLMILPYTGLLHIYRPYFSIVCVFSLIISNVKSGLTPVRSDHVTANRLLRISHLRCFLRDGQLL